MDNEEKLTVDNSQVTQLPGLGQVGQVLVAGTPGDTLTGGGSIQGIWTGGSGTGNTNPAFNYPDFSYITQPDLSIKEIKREMCEISSRMMMLRDMLERKMDVPPEKIERRKLAIKDK